MPVISHSYGILIKMYFGDGYIRCMMETHRHNRDIGFT